MKKSVQIEDALLNVVFAIVLALISFFFIRSAIGYIADKEIGLAIFGVACAAICLGVSFLLLKKVWSAVKNFDK